MTATIIQRLRLRIKWWKRADKSIRTSIFHFIWSELVLLYQIVMIWYKKKESYKRYTEWVDPDLKAIRKRMKYILKEEKRRFNDGKKRTNIEIDFEKLAEHGIISIGLKGHSYS